MVQFTDGEKGAEIYSAAADRDQATLIYEQAKGMVLQNPDLDNKAKIYATSKTIVVGSGSYRAISAEANTKHGYNSHLYIVDELHAQTNRELVDVLETSTGARSQPIKGSITTSDFDRESICNEKYDYACKVRDGIIDDPAFLPVIYGASKDDDWTDEKTWRKANPNLGVSVSLEYLKAQCKKAQEIPAYENTFKRLHLNIKTEQETRWLPMDKWDLCGGAVDESVLAENGCYVGLDLATTKDLAGYVMANVDEDGVYHIIPRLFIPEEKAFEREHRDRVPYQTWVKQGYIFTTPGNSIDYDFIQAKLLEDLETFNLIELAFDPFNASQFILGLTNVGLPQDKLIQFRQGFMSMNEPSKEFERLIISEKLRHGNHPVMRWAASNVAIKTDPAANIKPVKPDGKNPNKIDPIVMTIMAIGRAMAGVDHTSVYEERGLLAV